MAGIIESVTAMASESAINDYRNRVVEKLFDELDKVTTTDYQDGISKAIKIVRDTEWHIK